MKVRVINSKEYNVKVKDENLFKFTDKKIMQMSDNFVIKTSARIVSYK